ncbi:MAG: hypothetical protein HY804_00120 [Nitrospinae bacterium]|nr:hypothetical protein [Nitrospinota bacterium]
MRTFSPALAAALAKPHLRPAWLLRLNLVYPDGAAETLYLASHAYTLWGQQWKPLVISWGAVDRFFDPSLREIKVADVSVELDNRPGALGATEPSFSRRLRSAGLSASLATLYLWLDSEGLAEPAGDNQGDLVEIISGRPEIAGDITPARCPLDIVSRGGEYDDQRCPWGAVLLGRYSRDQWGTLPARLDGAWKPMVFGDDVIVEGVPLSGPVRAGRVEGPDALFDPASGADHVIISFPGGGAVNADNPMAAPMDIYLGDWRLTVSRPPRRSGSTNQWIYDIHSESAFNPYVIPSPLSGATPLFMPSASARWPRADESGQGPYASAEPARGAPYQFFHGAADTGNWRGGHHPGRSGPYIKKVFVNGVESTAAVKDDPFGIAWIQSAGAAISEPGNPRALRLKWTGVDVNFTTNGAYLRPAQLTAAWPQGYNAAANPCILGDFAIPASGGGAPASSQLGLVNAVRYPRLGSRIASVRFVMRYTGVETSAGTFNLQLFGTSYSFDSAQLADGAALAASGWSVALDKRGADHEIWPNNNGYPYTLTSPDPRAWDVYELSRDVTAEALRHIETYHGFADTFRAWFSGTIWPDTNSFILLACELEIAFEPAAKALEGPRVTALVGSPNATAGEIIASLIPADQRETGFDDPALPALKIAVDRQRSVCSLIRDITRQTGTQLTKNLQTGLWDMVKVSPARDNENPPTPVMTLSDGEMLAGDDGLPRIRRSRSAPEDLVNEVTVDFTGELGRASSVTARNEGSAAAHGLRTGRFVLGAGVTRAAAEDYARELLDELAEPADFYSMTFPLGPQLALEPEDTIAVTAALDQLNATLMRVVAVEADPASLARGAPAAVTIHARRYSVVRKGFGAVALGAAPFGQGQLTEN